MKQEVFKNYNQENRKSAVFVKIYKRKQKMNF